MTLTQDMVSGMSMEEKFSAIDMIWSTILPSEADDLEVPAWHIRMLNRRLERFQSGEAVARPMNEAFADLDARILG